MNIRRVGLFYPGDGVVDSLLAPRGSTTKRLKESDLVVTSASKDYLMSLLRATDTTILRRFYCNGTRR
ncbi:hypothetical protein Lal_00031297 [Lupinus albus]|nr:hypothetical protein Lal_00031297 [Lupinus albus]